MKLENHVKCALLLIVLALLSPGELLGQDEGPRSNRPGGVFASYLYSSFSDPIFRGPGDGGEVSVAEAASGTGLQLGYLYLGKSFGAGAGLTYWRTVEFNSFRAPTMPGSGSYVSYRNPHYSLWFFDMQLHWLPTTLNVSIYGVFGLGSNSESYTISDATAPFEEWNGSKDVSSFQYSYGFGLQIFPLRNVSLHAEYRRIPGATTTVAGDFLFTREGYDYYTVKDVKSRNHVGIISFGVSIGGLW
jgi:opacity protein-like surface antigen